MQRFEGTQSYVATEDLKVAAKKLEEFRAKHPASPLAKDAEELLKRLGGSL